MRILERLIGLNQRADDAAALADTNPSAIPQVPIWPPRDRWDTNETDPLTLVPVYRALQVLTTAAAQLPLVIERQGRTITGAAVTGIARRPDPELDRSDWIEQAVLSLALNGNLFIRRLHGPDKAIVGARILPPLEVTVTRHPSSGRIQYHHQGETIPANEVNHQTLMRIPGQLRGLGPIAAARAELTAAADVREYATNWFRGTGYPSGLLTTKSSKTKEEAEAIRQRWNEAAADPNNPSGIRVIGGDTTYTPLLLDPEDAQWLEVRQFSVTDFARLFGIPASLMLAAVDGTSMTYSNVTQEWLAFVRFTLSTYTRKIEEALTELAPLGQTIRFNFEGLLRADTVARYDSYAVAIGARFMTPDEARAIEGLPPLTPEQIAQLASIPTTPKKANA